jgi:hypothetical protein
LEDLLGYVIACCNRNNTSVILLYIAKNLRVKFKYPKIVFFVRRTKIIILMITLVVLIYDSSMIFAQNAYPGYDQPYRPLIGGIQIEITKAEWYGPSYSKGFCSLAFPVSFTENNSGKLGFITAGHCIETDNGGDYVDQPYKGSWWDWSNFIGRGIRSSWPYGGGNSDLDGALIRLENTGYEAFIYENGTHYFGSDREDRNHKVGITGYITPTKDMERKTIVYKSGRTTGITYGRIEQIDYKWYPTSNIEISPTIRITRCPDNQYCFYNDYISYYGDSGGVWYIRYVIYSERIDVYRVYDYGAKIIGIHNGKPDYDKAFVEAVASWATKVSEKWSDLKISYAICGSEYSLSCR